LILSYSALDPRIDRAHSPKIMAQLDPETQDALRRVLVRHDTLRVNYPWIETLFANGILR
jgi:hypothetical protein